MAVRNLTLHKLRVILTLLGLVAGVSSVIAMLAVAEGARLEARRQIATLGATKIIIRSNEPAEEVDLSEDPGDEPIVVKSGVTYGDYEQIVSMFPTVVAATTLREFHDDSAKEENLTPEQIKLSQITVTVNATENVKSTALALDGMLRQFHAGNDYDIVVPLDLLAKAEAAQRNFKLVLGSIAGISLLVGGIGIMNIMLASVSKRTREIGIRRALGARRRDIIEQFLIETAVISSVGGLAGVLLGLLAPPLYSYLSGVPVVIRPWSPIVAFLIAVLIGVGFGVYPARRAAMLDPVEALRAE
jgi:ABC-type antimicrobial peptide transport system permease subunit